MSGSPGFWKRLLSPFRRNQTQRSLNGLPRSHCGELCQSVVKLYIPKTLGEVNASMLLFGECLPERYSKDCWLEGHLDRFGNFNRNDFYSEDSNFICNETDSDFVYRTNDQSIGSLLSVDYDSVDNSSGSESDYQIHQFCDADSLVDNLIAETEHDELDSSLSYSQNDSNIYLDYILGEADDSTLQGSLESTVSEVLNMLDNTLMCHSDEIHQLNLPPPYSALYDISDPPSEPPPSYSDIFGTDDAANLNNLW